MDARGKGNRFSYVQASTDNNEMDPLFSTEGYMDEWFREVEKAQRETGVTVANFSSATKPTVP